jgi:hypothetical protein
VHCWMSPAFRDFGLLASTAELDRVSLIEHARHCPASRYHPMSSSVFAVASLLR